MEDPTENTKDIERRLRRRSSKRVSFADFYQVKEYCVSDNSQRRLVNDEENEEENRNPHAMTSKIEEDSPPNLTVNAASMALSILGQSQQQSTVSSSVHLLPMPCVSSDSSAIDCTVASVKSEALKSQMQSQTVEYTMELAQNITREPERNMEITCDLSMDISTIHPHTGSTKENASFDMDITCADDGRPSSGDDSMDLTRNLSVFPSPPSDGNPLKGNSITGLPRRSVPMEVVADLNLLNDMNSSVHDKNMNAIDDRPRSMNPTCSNVTVPTVSCMELSVVEDKTMSSYVKKAEEPPAVIINAGGDELDPMYNKVTVSDVSCMEMSVVEDKAELVKVAVPSVTEAQNAENNIPRSLDTSKRTVSTVSRMEMSNVEDTTKSVNVDKIVVPPVEDKETNAENNRLRCLDASKVILSTISCMEMSAVEDKAKHIDSNVSIFADKEMSVIEDRLQSIIDHEVSEPVLDDKDVSIDDDKIKSPDANKVPLVVNDKKSAVGGKMVSIIADETVPATFADAGMSIVAKTKSVDLSTLPSVSQSMSAFENTKRFINDNKVTTPTVADTLYVDQDRTKSVDVDKSVEITSLRKTSKDIFTTEPTGGKSSSVVDPDICLVSSGVRMNKPCATAAKDDDPAQVSVRSDPQSSVLASSSIVLNSPPIRARGRYVFEEAPSPRCPPPAAPKVEKSEELNTTGDLLARIVTNVTQLQTELAEEALHCSSPRLPLPSAVSVPAAASPLVLSSARKSVMPALWLARRREASFRGAKSEEESFRGTQIATEARRLESEALKEPHAAGKRQKEDEAAGRGSPAAKKVIRRDTFSLLDGSTMQPNPLVPPPKEEGIKAPKKLGRWNALTVKRAAEAARGVVKSLNAYEAQLGVKEDTTHSSFRSWEQLRSQLDPRRGALSKARAQLRSLRERLGSSERELAALEARLGGGFGAVPKAVISAAPTGLEQQQRRAEERLTASRITYVAFNTYQLAFGPASVLLCRFHLEPRTLKVTGPVFSADSDSRALLFPNLAALNEVVRKLLDDDSLEGLRFSDFIYEVWSRAMPLFVFLEDLIAVSEHATCLRLSATRLSLMLNSTAHVLNFWLDFDISHFGEGVELKPKFLRVHDRLGTLKASEASQLVSAALSRGDFLTQLVSHLQRTFPNLTTSL